MLVCRGASVSNRLSSIYSIEGKLRSNVMGKRSAQSVFFSSGQFVLTNTLAINPQMAKKRFLQIQ